MPSSSSSHKNHSNVSTLFFISLFLLSVFIFIFFFRTGDPALSLHTDLALYPSTLPIPLPDNNTITQTQQQQQPLEPEPAESEPAIDTETSVDDDDGTQAASLTKAVVDNANDDVSTNDGDGDVALKQQQLGCDLYRGTWVKDEDYPIYQSGSCPYVDEAYDCQINGRKDSEYTKWRWKPHGCDLPRVL